MTQGFSTNLCASLGAEVSPEVWPYKVPDSAIQGRSRRPATGCSPSDSKRWAATCRPVSLESSDHPDLNGGDPRRNKCQ